MLPSADVMAALFSCPDTHRGAGGASEGVRKVGGAGRGFLGFLCRGSAVVHGVRGYGVLSVAAFSAASLSKRALEELKVRRVTPHTPSLLSLSFSSFLFLTLLPCLSLTDTDVLHPPPRDAIHVSLCLIRILQLSSSRQHDTAIQSITKERDTLQAEAARAVAALHDLQQYER